MFSKTLRIVVIATVALFPAFAQRQKILALHGGGGSPQGFGNSRGMRDLEAALPEFEFVYAQGGYPVGGNNYLWIPDPPSKDEPTTSPDVADVSLDNLNRILEEQGPFFGILGYSQGAAFVPVYLANAPPGSFQKALMFCGYLTETHLGLLESVRTESPFGDISSLIWIGQRDNVIPPSLSRGLIPEFTSPTVITSSTGGHSVPATSDSTFDQVVAFLRDEDVTPTPPTPSPPPMEKPDDKPCEDDPDFTFKRKNRNCDWVAKKPDIRCDLTYKKKKVSSYCLEACGKCDSDGGCVDDAGFRYKNKQSKDCTWVAELPKARCKKTWRQKKVSVYCPKTCWACEK